MKKVINKKTFDYISYLSAFFFIIAIVSPFLYPTYLVVLGSLFLGILIQVLLVFFFTTKEIENKVINDKSKSVKTEIIKTSEYYFLRLFGFIFALTAIFFLIVWGGDEWAVNFFPYKVHPGFIIIPGLLSGVCFQHSKKYKKRKKDER